MPPRPLATSLVLLLTLGAALPAARAQAHPPGGAASVIYTCTDDRGRKITADRPIAACTGREQRVLNNDGSLRAILPPTLTADERAAKEAQERRQAEARAAMADATRRDRNLLARYPNEAPHQRARESALESVRQAMKATEVRLKELAAERQPLLAEAEFYQGKPLPAKLRGQLDANEAATEAQRDAASRQQEEVERINRLYDAELARLRQLWAGAAPGSLGPIQSLPSPVAASASAARPANLR